MGHVLQAFWHGFAFLWPVALAVLAWKMAERRGMVGGGGLATAARSAWAGVLGNGRAGRRRTRASFGAGSSGNIAFDDWRAAQIAELDAERRKLDATHREFARFVETLRRAKDREEFDGFMKSFAGDRGRVSAAAPERVEEAGV